MGNSEEGPVESIDGIREPKARSMAFARDGAQRIRSALDSRTLRGIAEAVSDLPQDRAGIRLYGIAGLKPFLNADGPIGRLAASVLGEACRPVRAILFDKTPTTNWALGWHQDRTIAVTDRIDTEGFGPWTVKGGQLHVAPPFSVLSGMATLRVHLDPVTDDNAPLLIAPGSHRFGRVPERDVPKTVTACGIFACHADVGDVWLYATPILHASDAAIDPRHRRVLQIDYSVEDLPGGLTWLGI